MVHPRGRAHPRGEGRAARRQGRSERRGTLVKKLASRHQLSEKFLIFIFIFYLLSLFFSFVLLGYLQGSLVLLII